MRAKLKVLSVNDYSSKNAEGIIFKSSEAIQFTAVCKSESYDDTGLDENNTYAKFTPTANLDIAITNPALFDKFLPGQQYYVDFTSAD